jgi:uncharacterized membrane protein/nitrite reductase/ring-hydroxylating ferredoxin subunit
VKSRANIKSHPLHPILVVFPIAFFTGTFFSDLFYLFSGNEFYSQAAKFLETGGIIFALLAAVPGIIDYFFTVPPASSGKKRATQHGLLNITMVIIFSAALFLRSKSDTGINIILILETAGVILLSVAGWLGGTLVHRNQIGIDHRYANAGKWNEETIKGTAPFELKDLGKMAANQMKLFHVNGKRIVVGRTEEGFAAFDDYCTHRGGSLADGVMICGTVQCPWHGSQFDVKNGSVKAGPAKKAIGVYKIELRDQKYYLHF